MLRTKITSTKILETVVVVVVVVVIIIIIIFVAAFILRELGFRCGELNK